LPTPSHEATISDELGKSEIRFSHKTLDLLYNYPLPGYIRELENVIQRGIVLTEGQIFTEKERPISIQSHGSVESDTKENSLSFEREDTVTPLEFFLKTILHTLKISYVGITEAAKKLKACLATLYLFAEKHKIKI
jgi:DNA-binding NtrC family response regulator